MPKSTVKKLKTKGRKKLEPNSRTRALAHVAAENGEVKAKNQEGGAQVIYDTQKMPMREMETTAESGSQLGMFNKLSKIMFRKIEIFRETQKQKSASQ